MNNDVKADLAAFSQGFLGAVFRGVGEGTGCLVGGISYAAYGPHYTFFGNALALLPLFMVYIIQFIHCRTTLRPAKADTAI